MSQRLMSRYFYNTSVEMLLIKISCTESKDVTSTETKCFKRRFYLFFWLCIGTLCSCPFKMLQEECTAT